MPKAAIITAIFLAVLFITCRRLDFSNERPQEMIEKSKAWFENYLAKQPVDKMFENANYIWNKAKLFTFDNSYKVITVPVMEKNQNVKYTGRRILYLFPWKNGKGYYVCLYELLPDFKHYQKNKGNINLSSFDGYICSWDLRRGYIGGAKYVNGTAVSDIKITLSENNQVPASVHQRITADLPPVTVYAVYQNSMGQYMIHLMNGNGYSMSYFWNPSEGNPCEYTNCTSSDPEDYLDEGTINQIMQQLADEQWVNEHVKDSTNNPCATNAINILSSISSKLPAIIRSVFGADPSINITFKMQENSNWQNGQPPEGAHQAINLNSSNFTIYLNSYYENSTDLGLAATIIHEALHSQLMYWFGEAIADNNVSMQNYLAENFGYVFTSESTNINQDLAAIINGGNQTQHDHMLNVYTSEIASALYQFTLAANINVTWDHCRDVAYTGTFDSNAFNNLSYSDKLRISERVLAEKDPYANLNDPNNSNNTVNQNDVPEKGHPCQ